MSGPNIETLTPVEKMSRDIAKGAVTMGEAEARFLVDAYYAMQKQRIESGNRVSALSKSEEPHEVILWLQEQSRSLEGQVKRALGKYVEAHPVGQWALSIRGIGPVIAAGLIAHLSVRPWTCAETAKGEKKCSPEEPHGPGCCYERIETVGHWWRFAGLDPTVRWEKGKRRPWNASLKVLCWKMGESFVKTKGHEEGFYGALYDQRKAIEVEKNDRGDYAALARKTLEEWPRHAQKAIYAGGKLPDGRIHLRAQRWAVKIFLAHLHEVAYRHEFGTAPPLPYPIAHLGHADRILAPK